MKFGKTFRKEMVQEWRFYALDYKALKQTLKQKNKTTKLSPDTEEFHRILTANENKLALFYEKQKQWSEHYMTQMEESVKELQRQAEAEANETCRRQSLSLKEEYEQTAGSPHFKAYLYAKKALDSFHRELQLLQQFFQLHQVAFSKILKKYDKRTNSIPLHDSTMKRLLSSHPFLFHHYSQETTTEEEDPQAKDDDDENNDHHNKGLFLNSFQKRCTALLETVQQYQPHLPEGWKNRTVLTFGSFDLFHRGHENLLRCARDEFGASRIVVVIASDASVYRRKLVYPVDKLEARMAKVQPWVDAMFVVEEDVCSLPQLYQMGYKKTDDESSYLSWCGIVGEDCLAMAKANVSALMPVYGLPRTDDCSSSLLRLLYHSHYYYSSSPEQRNNDSEEEKEQNEKQLRWQVAFAPTRKQDGKPINDNGSLLLLQTTTISTSTKKE
jgi:cytidyltransferase-like protein